jgi:pyruvate-ferredoxin/flavodoxin oxidoreductase
MVNKKVKFYVIDAIKVARATGMGTRINTVMQTCFFALSGVLPRDEAIEQIKYTIKKTYGRKGEDVVRKNIEAVDQTLANLFEVPVPGQITSGFEMPDPVHGRCPNRIKETLGKIYGGLGDRLPVSAFPCDGTFPTATAQYEKRNLALEIPVWDEKTCIQCGKCAAVCPHATSG